MLLHIGFLIRIQYPILSNEAISKQQSETYHIILVEPEDDGWHVGSEGFVAEIVLDE